MSTEWTKGKDERWGFYLRRSIMTKWMGLVMRERSQEIESSLERWGWEVPS